MLHLADDRLFDEHRARGHHPERPERLGAARRAVERCGEAGRRTNPLPPRDATDEELARAHDPAYLAELMKLDGHWTSLDADTYLSPASVRAARRAAGAAISLVDAILASPSDPTGLALLRPPGHHATHRTGMGFCLVNNIAIAAHAALARGLQRVAIVDFDVHHGNGTQDIFWRDPRVLFISLHQWPFYPGSGLAREVGEGDGKGYTLNVPLSEGATDAVYEAAFDETLVPVLDEYAPELLLVSAGFDAHERDPRSAMRLTAAAYASMTRKLAGVARRSAQGRLGVVLEGGYHLGAIEESLIATLHAATGLAPTAGAPEAAEASGAAGAAGTAGAAGAAGAATTPAPALIAPRHRSELDRARHMALKRWSTL
ncbi:MAG TPA: histone deacetylase [Candidatus Nanopelagicales bacterium]|nr:histone deacetylase [Candidatus Nanopelagicales bacterium]